MVAWLRLDQPPRAELTQYRSPSLWIALARRPGHLASLAVDPRWQRLHRRLDARPWTDDFSNLVSALRWRL